MTDSTTRGGRTRIITGLLIAAILLAGGFYLVGRATAPVPPAPTSESAAAGSLRDMQVHHAQAVQMALLVRDRTADPEIRQLAYDIAVTQSNQEGQMYGLLEAWDLPQASAAPAMTWADLPTIDGSDPVHGHGSVADDGTMPGLASDAEIAKLGRLTGVDAERLFLQLMIRHHQGGIEMAEAVLARTGVSQVVSLATGILRAQEAEIVAMEGLLSAR